MRVEQSTVLLNNLSYWQFKWQLKTFLFGIKWSWRIVTAYLHLIRNILIYLLIYNVWILGPGLGLQGDRVLDEMAWCQHRWCMWSTWKVGLHKRIDWILLEITITSLHCEFQTVLKSFVWSIDQDYEDGRWLWLRPCRNSHVERPYRSQQSVLHNLQKHFKMGETSRGI